jgi:hypothetical protein
LRIAGPANQVREVANNFAPDDFGDTSVTEVRWGGRREIVPGFVEQDKYLVVAAPWMGSGMRVIDGILSRAWKDVVLANCLRQGTAPGDLDIRLETRDHEVSLFVGGEGATSEPGRCVTTRLHQLLSGLDPPPCMTRGVRFSAVRLPR